MSRKKKASMPPVTREAAQNAALERFKPLLSAEDFRLMLDELMYPLPLAFRVNPLKATAGTEQEWAKRYGWKLEAVPYCPTGFWVPETRDPVAMTLEHRMGHYYIQDAASMLPVELFDLDDLENPLVLDLAASPGGKTTHLSARMRDRGLVIANDSAADRITALRLVLQTWGSTNAAVTRFPGEKFGQWYPETFDRILLDAPCSMQSLRSTDAHPMRAISVREQESLAHRQESLLAAAIAALKPGGQVVYSTCTLAPEENEAVLDQVLSRFSGNIEIESLESRLPGPAFGLTEAYGRLFDPQVSRAARLWPHRFHTSGFFAALIRKTGSVSFQREAPPNRPLTLVGQTKLPAASERVLRAVFLDRYGHDLAAVLSEHNLQLWQNPAGIFAVPAVFIEQFSGLPCQLLGMKLAETVSGEWIPAHDWVARFSRRFSGGTLTIPDDFVPHWLRGEDLVHSTTDSGVVIIFDTTGRCLGRGQAQGGKVKNLLPRRLV